MAQFTKAFTVRVDPTVDALKKMCCAVEEELRSLLSYFGEQPDSPDGCKPEDFFGLIVSFSSSLQVKEQLLYSDGWLSLNIGSRNAPWR
jgi:diaphanous 1